MQKVKDFISRYWLTILVGVGLNLMLNNIIARANENYIQRSVDKAYVDGFNKGKTSVKLDDVCFEPEIVGFGVDEKRKMTFDIVRCKVNLEGGVNRESPLQQLPIRQI